MRPSKSTSIFFALLAAVTLHAGPVNFVNLAVQTNGTLISPTNFFGANAAALTANVGNINGGQLIGTTLNTTNGNVGIGTNAPGAKLDVMGNANIAGALTLGGSFNVPINQYMLFGSSWGVRQDTSGALSFTYGAPRVWLPSNGGMIFSNSATGATARVDTNGIFNGNGSGLTNLNYFPVGGTPTAVLTANTEYFFPASGITAALNSFGGYMTAIPAVQTINVSGLLVKIVDGNLGGGLHAGTNSWLRVYTNTGSSTMAQAAIFNAQAISGNTSYVTNFAASFVIGATNEWTFSISNNATMNCFFSATLKAAR